MSNETFKQQWRDHLEAVEAALTQALAPRRDLSEAFAEVLRYSVLGGGKRVRPVLCLAAAAACGAPPRDALPAACALELIHAYSLVHDDLPAMDDDDERRGLPTVHRKYGEAIAILAGDGLQAEAFRLLSEAPADGSPVGPEARLAIIREVARAAGAAGMVGGQHLDITADEASTDRARLEALHRLKTGALIRAAAMCGGLVAGAGVDELCALTRYGAAVGSLFQLTDDLLDLVQSQAEDVGAERASKEAAVNFAVQLGEPALRAEIEARLGEALEAAAVLTPRHGFLVEFARMIACREA